MKTKLGTVLVGTLLVFAGLALHARRAPLQTRVRVETSDTGIPGLHKWYDASIGPASVFPARITICSAINDAMGKEESVMYGLDQWDEAAKQWRRVRNPSKRFCQPYPLGIIKGEIVAKWLRPGQTVATGSEILGGSFHKGDVVRYVIFPDLQGGRELVTEAITIEEQMESSDVPYRLKH